MDTQLNRIAVLGAGKMGAGIAQFFATKGYEVTIIHDSTTRPGARPHRRSAAAWMFCVKVAS